MKLYRNAAILVVVLALLITVFVVAKNKQTTTPDSGTNTGIESILISEIDNDKMTSMTIKSGGATYSFEKRTNGDKKEWAVVSPKDLDVNPDRIQDIASTFISLYALKLVDENASDLAQFGFAKPVEITMNYEGGSKSFELGDLSSTKDSYYFREKDSKKVYTIETYYGANLAITKDSLRSNTLFAVQAEEILGLSMSRGGSLVFSSGKNADGDWSLTAPFEWKADDNAIAPILEAIANTATYESFIEEKAADLDKYGLKNPAYILQFETAKGKTKLLIGSEKQKGSEVYAMVEGKSEVFTLDPGSFTFLDKPLIEIADSFAYIANIGDVSKLVVEIDGETTVADIVSDNDGNSEEKFTVNGKNATDLKMPNGDDLFKKYYQAVIGATIADIEIGAKPVGKSEITFTYSLDKAPGTMKVEFISKDSKYYYVLRNGKYTNVLILKSFFDTPDTGLRAIKKQLLETIK